MQTAPSGIELPTLTHLWEYSYRLVQPTRTFITFSEQSEGLSYKKISALAHCLSAYFIRSGVKKGFKLGMICENAPMYVAADLAVHFAGGVNVTLSPDMPPKLMRRLIREFEIKILYLSGYELYCKHKSWLDPLANELIILCNVPPLLELSEGDKLVALYCATDVGKNYWRENMSAVRNTKYSSGTDDPAAIFVLPDGEEDFHSIRLTHAELIRLTFHLKDRFKLTPAGNAGRKNILCANPYARLFGRVAGLYLPLITGHPVFLNRTDRTLLRDIDRCTPSVLIAESKALNALFDSVKKEFEADYSFRSRYFDSAFTNAVKAQDLKTKKESVPIGLQTKVNFAKRTVLKPAKKNYLSSVDMIFSQPDDAAEMLKKKFAALSTDLLIGPDLTDFNKIHSFKRKSEHQTYTVSAEI